MWLCVTFVIAGCDNAGMPSGICSAGGDTDNTPSRDLYCLELTPAPGIGDSATGTIELAHPGGPFSLSVTADGSQVYSPRAILAGLPDPASLGPYTTYVAWVTTPVMSPFIKLGSVTNGITELPSISFDKFIVIVSAEESGAVSDRAGRLVLRGGSPSTRLQPPDVQEFMLGDMIAAGDSAHGQHAAPPPSLPGAPARWTTVPMPANLIMLPAEMALRPTVAPFLPSPSALPPQVRRSEVTRLENGDTLSLTAGHVRRRIHGREYSMYAFNGQVPGPLLWVPKDAEIIVRFRNALDQPSTVHWHGLRLDHRFDGAPHLSQPPVPPGDSFTYVVRFPDSGLYWYHSHVREDIQQDLGLAGNIMVRGDSTLPAVHREEVLLLDDILIGEDGLVPYGADLATHALMGRFGNIFLVNGEPSWRGSARPGEVVRLWLTNAANTRTFNISLSNARMKLVASDMSPFSRDEWVESVVIAPAERYAVDVRFGSAGPTAILNRVRGIDHLFGDFLQEIDTIGVIMVAGENLSGGAADGFDGLRARDSLAVEMVTAASSASARPEHTFVFGLRTENLPFFTARMMSLDSSYFHPAEWSGTMPMMNWATSGAQARWFIRHAESGDENEAIRVRFRQGDRARLRLVNQRNSIHAMQHPIHVHGQRFLVLDVNGVKPAIRAWKDTVLLPAGAVVDILVEFDNPGRWMLHCHIAEHLGSGMMMSFQVDYK